MDKDLLLSLNRPQRLCMNCNAPLAGIERHPSILKTTDKRLERLDFCPECWQQMKDEAYESFWITKRVVKDPKVRKLTRRERSAALRALFESLWERRESEDVGPHIFLMAHLLLKWGGLRWKENRPAEDGREIIIFEDPTTGDRLEVISVASDDARLPAIEEEIEQFLKQYASEDQEVL